MKTISDQLTSIVSEVLHYVWDPIGIAGVPQARYEYDGYVGTVMTLLNSGASEEELQTLLVRIADERMGLPGREKQSKDAATLLTDWHDYLLEGRA